MGVALFFGVCHSCVRWVGLSQNFQRIDHPVLKKINNIVYLKYINGDYVIDLGRSLNLPSEIKNMSFVTINAKDDLLLLKSNNVNSECLFLQFNLSDQTQAELDEIIQALDGKNCVFINSPHLKIKSYFSFKKPRWFFNLMEVDLQKSRFLTSLGLQAVATLKGDFIVVDPKRTKISDPLLAEIKRRDIVIFKVKSKTDLNTK